MVLPLLLLVLAVNLDLNVPAESCSPIPERKLSPVAALLNVSWHDNIAGIGFTHGNL